MTFRSRIIGIRAVSAIVLALATGGAWAQSTSATIVGSVRDVAGRTVDVALVQARSARTGATRTATTDVAGTFRLDLLEPGRWELAARGPDGSISPTLAVELALQQTVEVTLVLQGEIREEVEVVADAPLVDPRRVGGELRIVGSQSDALPIAGRSVTELATLDSAVQVAPAGNYFGERASAFVVHGQTGRSNSYLVDGVDNNDQSSGTTLNGFFSQQVVREFVVLTSQFAPEFGRASGGVVNIVTQQGGNEFGGDGFVQGTRPALNSSGDLVDGLPDGPGSQDTPGRLSFGVRYGGPIRKDRAFFFVAYEHQGADEVVPFTGIARDGVAGGYENATVRSDNLFARTDFNLGQRNFLMLRLSADDRSTEQLNVGGRWTPESGFALDERDVQFAATWKSVLSPTLLNEVRFLGATSDFSQRANSGRPGVDRPSGLFGGNNLNTQDREETRFQLVENLTWTKGRHTMKFGLDVLRSNTTVATRFNPTGNFIYTTDDPFEPGDCGNLIISAIDPDDPRAPVPCPGVPGVDDDGDGRIDEPGYVYTYPLVYQFIFGNPTAELPDTRVGAFAQDSWRPSERWLLEYGLRYDLSTYTLPEDARVESTIPNGGAGRDTDNLAPRFGFTFTPFGDRRTVVRGGAGLFYDKLVLGYPAVAAITSGTEIGVLFPQGLTLEITEDVVEDLIDEIGYDKFLELLGSGLLFPEELILRFSTATEIETPYTVQYNLGVEQALSPRSMVSASVIRALGYHLPLSRDLNPVVAIRPPCLDEDGNPIPGDLSCLGVPVHRDPEVGSIAAVTSEGRSWYTGLDLAYRWMNGADWFSAAYSWSKALDMGPDPLRDGFYLPPDSDDIEGEKARADYDRPHRVVLAGQTALPWLGLRLSGVVQYASGAPFNVVSGDDANLDGILSDRPVGVPRNAGSRASLDAVNEARAVEGLPPVDSLDEPDLLQLDLRVAWPFALRDGRSAAEAYVQVFNVFDRWNGGPIEGRATSQSFGEAVGYAGPPRTVEIGMRVGF